MDPRIAHLHREKVRIERELAEAKRLGVGKVETIRSSRERATSYADVLEERERAKRRRIAKRTEDRRLDRRLRVFATTSDYPFVKDTDYPRFAKKYSTEETAWTGPLDEEEWGPRGRTFYWHRYFAPKYAIPMSLLVRME